jgi:predicted ATP-dependent serine protease
MLENRGDLGWDDRTGPSADQKTIGEVVEGRRRICYCWDIDKEHNRMDNDKDRERALDLAISQIEKQFGKGAIMKLGAEAIARDIPTISTGSLSLDLALGIGGLPRGRVAEIYGPEASGKTTMALHVVARKHQKVGGRLTIRA